MFKQPLREFFGQVGQHPEFPFGVALGFDMDVREKLAALGLAPRQNHSMASITRWISSASSAGIVSMSSAYGRGRLALVMVSALARGLHPERHSLLVSDRRPAHPQGQKNDVAKHPEAFNHVGLLINGPPDTSGLPFI